MFVYQEEIVHSNFTYTFTYFNWRTFIFMDDQDTAWWLVGVYAVGGIPLRRYQDNALGRAAQQRWSPSAVSATITVYRAR